MQLSPESLSEQLVTEVKKLRDYGDSEHRKVVNYRQWLLTVVEDAESLEEAKSFAQRGLDKEDCPEDIRAAPSASNPADELTAEAEKLGMYPRPSEVLPPCPACLFPHLTNAHDPKAHPEYPADPVVRTNEARAFRERHIRCSQGAFDDGMGKAYKHASDCEYPDEHTQQRTDYPTNDAKAWASLVTERDDARAEAAEFKRMLWEERSRHDAKTTTLMRCMYERTCAILDEAGFPDLVGQRVQTIEDRVRGLARRCSELAGRCSETPTLRRVLAALWLGGTASRCHHYWGDHARRCVLDHNHDGGHIFAGGMPTGSEEPR